MVILFDFRPFDIESMLCINTRAIHFEWKKNLQNSFSAGIKNFTKFGVGTSNGSALRVLTDRQTHGTDSITSTAYAGGKNPPPKEMDWAWP